MGFESSDKVLTKKDAVDMITHKHHKLITVFLAATVVIAPLLIAKSADAATTATFKMKRTWWGWTTTQGTPSPWIDSQYHPRSKGPNKSADPTVVVGSETVSGRPAPRFTFPAKFIRDYTWSNFCAPGTCGAGYPQFSQQYSYWNLKGSFRPNNSKFGGASKATTVIFPTTMGNPMPPINSGHPVTATTTPCVGGGLYTPTSGKNHCGYLAQDLPPGGTAFGGPAPRKAGDPIRFVDGNYDFDRAGSIMITPGKNRFGGTMLFFYGPNHDYYQRTTINTGYSTHAYGWQMDVRTPNANTAVGDVQYGGPWNKYRMTEPYRTQRSITANGGFYEILAPYFYTLVPFTTGMVTAVEPHGGQLSQFTLTGYDNRTPLGVNGIISLVRPRIVHGYEVPHDPEDPINLTWAYVSAWQMTFHFREAPEPGGMLMFSSGVVALAGLYRRRKS